MRRLAERPQNLTLAFQEFAKQKVLQKIGLCISIISIIGATFILATKLFKK